MTAGSAPGNTSLAGARPVKARMVRSGYCLLVIAAILAVPVLLHVFRPGTGRAPRARGDRPHVLPGRHAIYGPGLHHILT